MAQDRPPLTDHDVYQRLCRARAFIDRHYCRPISLERISSEACFSRYHFLRLFRQAFHQTPHQYLTQKRIERAKELLATGELTVTSVCFEVGFESLGSFSSLFRKCVGDSPVRYRTRAVRLARANQIARAAERAPIPACFLIRFGLLPSPA
jgi:AraC-like DNA-binding protein